MADPSYRMVILDELNIVLRYDYIPLDEVLEALRNKPEDLHVVVTGRNAKKPLMELADLVTEMTQVKHPFRSGVKAQIGIEFWPLGIGLKTWKKLPHFCSQQWRWD